MAGRALAFADADIIRMGTEDYIAVAADDWYQRRRQDAEGEFFRRVADQGPRKGQGGSTRQGIYCLTADGHLLAYKNAGQNPDVMREVLSEGLARWAKLPESQRRPGAVEIGSPESVDERYSRTLPPGGLVVKAFTRALDPPEQGDTADDAPACRVEDEAAARDHLWLTEREWRSLIPTNACEGQTLSVPAEIAERILRFHLVDNTRGEPPHWSREEIRRHELTLTVLETSPSGTRLRLEGSALLSTAADPDRADRGYDVSLLGYIDYDAKADRISRFDVAALGEHWGQGPYTRGARPGRTPLGVAFQLADATSASNAVPPQAARDLHGYFGGRPR
ncbi:MAG: hypothetical protein KY476_04250 [Planctomycetes bacterium]|nr:hypothetical protein [Planctomycetota bacterium]